MNQQLTSDLKRHLSVVSPYRSSVPIAVMTPVPGLPWQVGVLGGPPEALQDSELILVNLKDATRVMRQNPHLEYVPVERALPSSDIAEVFGMASAFSVFHMQGEPISALVCGAITLVVAQMVTILQEKRRCYTFAAQVRQQMRNVRSKQFNPCETHRVTVMPGKNLAFCVLPLAG